MVALKRCDTERKHMKPQTFGAYHLPGWAKLALGATDHLRQGHSEGFCLKCALPRKVMQIKFLISLRLGFSRPFFFVVTGSSRTAQFQVGRDHEQHRAGTANGDASPGRQLHLHRLERGG